MINSDIYLYFFFFNYSVLLIPSLNTRHGKKGFLHSLSHTTLPLTLPNTRLLLPLLGRLLFIFLVLICSACSPLKCPNLTTVVWLQQEGDDGWGTC